MVSGCHHPESSLQIHGKCSRSGPFHLHLLQLLPPGKAEEFHGFHVPSSKHVELGNLCLTEGLDGKSWMQSISYTVPIDDLHPDQNPAMNRICHKLHKQIICVLSVWQIIHHVHCEFIVIFLCPILGCPFFGLYSQCHIHEAEHLLPLQFGTRTIEQPKIKAPDRGYPPTHMNSTQIIHGKTYEHPATYDPGQEMWKIIFLAEMSYNHL